MNMSSAEVARLLARRNAAPAPKPRKKPGTGDLSLWKAWVAEMQREGGGLFLPLRTVCELNDHSHWRNRQKRAAMQHEAIAPQLGKANGLARFQRLQVTLTRYAPGLLDAQDNLRSAFKHVVDCIAKCVGVDDKSDWYDWKYRQVKTRAGCYGVRILLTPIETKGGA